MDLETLREDARAKALGDSSDTTFSNDDCDRYLNQYYRQAIEIAMSVNGDWQVNGEIATADIVSSQREYALPSGLLRLDKVYINYDDTRYFKAKQRDPHNIEGEPDQATYGYFPTYPEFDLLEDGIRIYIPNETISAVTAGIKIHYRTDITELSDTGDEPDMPKFVHKYMSVGAAYEYCQDNEAYKKADRLERRMLKLEEMVKKHYANRSTARRLQLTPSQEDYY